MTRPRLAEQRFRCGFRMLNFDRSIGAFFTIALIFLIRSGLAGVHALPYPLAARDRVTANRRLVFARFDFGWRRFENS
jgi:hypothetical protein